MPQSAPKVCTHPGCGAKIYGYNRRCDKHPPSKTNSVGQDKRNKKDSVRLYNLRRWRKERVVFLRANPMCVDCREEGIIRSANVVDHDTPHNNDYDKFFNQDNWRSRCKSHHDKKTAMYDGGFGNKKSSKGGVQNV